MKLDIKELIAERLNHEVSDSSLVSDGLLEKRLDVGADEFAIILPNGLMEDIQKSGKYPFLRSMNGPGFAKLRRKVYLCTLKRFTWMRKTKR